MRSPEADPGAAESVRGLVGDAPVGDAAGVTGSAPHRPQALAPRIDPNRLARLLRRLILPFAVAATIAFFVCFGALKVPPGMDTLANIAPGSTCIIDKRRSSLQKGSAVFVDLQDGGTLLSRVAEVLPDGSFTVQNDRQESAMPDSDDFGPLARERLRGTVLVVFGPDTVAMELPPRNEPPEERLRGR